MLVELRVLQARLEFKITESSTGDPALRWNWLSIL